MVKNSGVYTLDNLRINPVVNNISFLQLPFQILEREHFLFLIYFQI